MQQLGPQPGTVYLVGAGPGDPGLVTVRATELLAGADVIVYDGLVNPLLLDLAPASAERVYAGKKRGRAAETQDAIHAVLIARARAGRAVIRLKGGDPFMFGRGGEECQALVAAGIPFEVVPGVSAATAVAAYAGIPLTHRDVASTVAFATAHEADDKAFAAVDAAELARVGTVVLFMGVQSLARSSAELIGAGRAPSTPVAVIRWGTLPAQEVITGTLADIAERAHHLRPPGLVVIGGVVALRDSIAWAERRPLHGARILVTRPRAQAGELLVALARLGAEPIACPVIAIEPATGDDAAALEAALARPAAIIAFTSSNAVDAVMDCLDATGRDARSLAGATLASVGAATTRALAAHSLRADLTVPPADVARGASALAELLIARGVAGQRILFPRAADGRDELPRLLGAAGASVDTVTAYHTVRTPAAELTTPLARLAAGEVDLVACMSPSAADALAALAPAEVLARPRWVAGGATTAAALARLGLPVAAEGAMPAALITAWAARARAGSG